MRFTPDFLDEIRTRLPVSEVVGQRVKLRRQGKEFAGLSPFNAEKTPSFFVNDQKGFYHCFSSGRHGDIFRFLMETEGLSFPEAVERLAGQAGLALPMLDPRAQERERERAGLAEIVEMAARFFEAELAGTRGRAARDYLARRGLGHKTQETFRIGYAPASRSALREHLASAGVSVEEMAAAGLVVTGEDIPVAYDRFRDRVIFPIEDMRGRVVAFGGRTLSSDVQAKYLNSPETALFHKGGMLFNGHRARGAAHEKGTLIVVEGYVDAIAVHAAGFPHAVAPLGTALGEDQLRLLWRMAEEPILCFDGDGAGQRAAYRAMELALPLIGPGRSLRFAMLPDGQDPDDLVREAGAGAFGALLTAAEPLVDMLWGREAAGLQAEIPERRAAAEARLRDLVATIGNETVRRHYEVEIAARLHRLFRRSDARAPSRWRGRGGGHNGGRLPDAMSPRVDSSLVTASLRRSGLLSRAAARLPERETVLVATMLHHPALLAIHAEAFAEIEIGARELDSLRRRIIEHAAIGETGAETLKETLAAEGLAELIGQLDRLLAERGHWQARAGAADRDAETGWMQALALQRKAGALHKDLRAAEAAFSLDPNEENWVRLRDLREELCGIDGEEAAIEGYGTESGRPARMD